MSGRSSDGLRWRVNSTSVPSVTSAPGAMVTTGTPATSLGGIVMVREPSDALSPPIVARITTVSRPDSMSVSSMTKKNPSAEAAPVKSVTSSTSTKSSLRVAVPPRLRLISWLS